MCDISLEFPTKENISSETHYVLFHVCIEFVLALHFINQLLFLIYKMKNDLGKM